MKAISVVFNQRGYWSKSYTYLYDKEIYKGDIVIVPTDSFFSVGKVVKIEDNYELDPNINYKKISLVLQDLK